MVKSDFVFDFSKSFERKRMKPLTRLDEIT